MRQSQIERNTKETQIKLSLNLDSKGKNQINTGIGFFDHMLDLFAFRSGMTIDIECKGDLIIDGHHSVEDIGIALGLALKEALADKKGIQRYGSSRCPMDETLVQVDLDLANRSFLVFNADFKAKKVGDFETELTEEFFRALAFNSGMTLHINLLYGKNTHHKIEAIFKAFGMALKEAVAITSSDIPSTKGVL